MPYHMPSQSNDAPAGHQPTELITTVLLDALCSPHLYEIEMRGGELFIRPRPHMHSQRLSAVAG